MGLSNCDSKSEWEHGGAARTGQGGASARRGDLAGSHSPARVGGAPLPCARHFLWGTFLHHLTSHNSTYIHTSHFTDQARLFLASRFGIPLVGTGPERCARTTAPL